MIKMSIRSNREKNTIIDRIIDAFREKDGFLILGHKSPDEDCIASMVAVSLLLSKFTREVSICLSGSVNPHFHYLLNICRYNAISVLGSCGALERSYGAVVVCDTPKPSMIEQLGHVRPLMESPGTLIIEIDHHIGGDSEYIGNEGYRLVTEASSTSELVGHLAFKLSAKRDLLERFQIEDLLSRNLVLAILTGIIGDTNMGQFLGSRRERKYYKYFSSVLNRILIAKTVKETNFSNIEDIFIELQKHSSKEEKCFDFVMSRKRFSASIGFVLLSDDEMNALGQICDNDTFISVTRAAANTLAEESGKLGLVVYTEGKGDKALVQFRLRRSHLYRGLDLREVLSRFAIADGGGHEGAIGFRMPGRDLVDIEDYVARLLSGIETEIGMAG
jgi:nanoRNase/pAp phosphatase (c-di-AMP/oligoRNAs hydrolase)